MVAFRFLRDLKDDANQQSMVLPKAMLDDLPTRAPYDMELNPTVTMTRKRAGVDEIGSSRNEALLPPNGGFRVLPERATLVPASAENPHWRVELAFDDPSKPALRLEVAGAVVIGRGGESDLSLEEHDAFSHGISRKHAMFRPSKRGLYFFDSGSTNGTRHNGIEIGSNAITLNLGDVIRLGTLALTVRLIDKVG